MGTITTISHCLVKDGKAYTGTKEEIVNQLVKYRLDNRQLVIQVKGYQEVHLWSYGEDMTDDDIHRDIIKEVFDRLHSGVAYGYKHYREIL